LFEDISLSEDSNTGAGVGVGGIRILGVLGPCLLEGDGVGVGTLLRFLGVLGFFGGGPGEGIGLGGPDLSLGVTTFFFCLAWKLFGGGGNGGGDSFTDIEVTGAVWSLFCGITLARML